MPPDFKTVIFLTFADASALLAAACMPILPSQLRDSRVDGLCAGGQCSR